MSLVSNVMNIYEDIKRVALSATMSSVHIGCDQVTMCLQSVASVTGVIATSPMTNTHCYGKTQQRKIKKTSNHFFKFCCKEG